MAIITIRLTWKTAYEKGRGGNGGAAGAAGADDNHSATARADARRAGYFLELAARAGWPATCGWST